MLRCFANLLRIGPTPGTSAQPRRALLLPMLLLSAGLAVPAAAKPQANEPPAAASETPPPASEPALQQDEAAAEAAELSESGRLRKALEEGRFWVHLNYRFAFIDEQGFEKDAYASTLRTVLGYESLPWHGVKALLEFENVTNIGNDLYNSTQNGVTDRPTEADPTGTSINQVYGSYVGLEEMDLRVGRQQIALDNHRFVGTVPWRQKYQTFDAGSAKVEIDAFDLFYAYAGRINTINRTIDRVDIHMLNLAYDFEDVGRLTAYGYYLDYEDTPTKSNVSVGARFQGEHGLNEGLDLLYTAELAHQEDAADNPDTRNVNYYRADLGLRVKPFTIRLAGEILEGDGDPNSAFQTPLATLHKFNGWADRFLTTPDDGLQDLFLDLGSKLGDKGKITLTLHDFRSTSGSRKYGNELDLVASYAMTPKSSASFKFAAYQSSQDFVSTDVTTRDVLKAWVWLTYKF